MTDKPEDRAGRQSKNTVFGHAVTGNRVVQAQSNFRYNISPSDYFTETVNSGNYGVDRGKGFVETGTNSGTARVYDKQTVRYRTGTEAGMYFTAAFPERDTDSQLRAGMFDSNDGVFIGHDGSEYTITLRSFGTDNTVPRGSWRDPLDGSGASSEKFTLETLSVFHISYGYLGQAPITIEALGKNGWIKIHEFTFFDSQTDVNLQSPVLPPRIEAESTGSVNARVESGSWMGYTMSKVDNDPQSRPFTRVGERTNVASATNEHIITLRNKETYQGQTNKIPFVPVEISPAINSSQYAMVYVVKNASFGSALTYADVDTDSSTAEYSTDATTVSGGQIVDIIPISGGGSGRSTGVGSSTEAIPNERINAGETVSVYARSPGTPETYVSSITWSELF